MAGFECEFTEKVPWGIQQADCPICLLVLKEPYQATCCGKSFCRECIQQVKDSFKPCPTCKDGNFNIFHNKGLQQSLYDFQVNCTHKSKGCEWTGELRELDNHLNSDPSADKSLEGCPFTVISCPLTQSCASFEVKLLRKDMSHHLSDKLVHHNQTTWTKMSEEIRKNLHTQLQSKEQYLEQYIKRQGESKPCVGQLVAPVELIMTDFEQHRKGDDEWFSPPFYTNPNGYKMCLKVAPNGWAEGKGTHISMYVHMMRGEFDEQLKWPFRGDITVQLLNWEVDEKPFARMIPFDDTTQEFTAGRVTYRERAEDGRGFCRFTSHVDIRSKYLKNDCLKMCVQNIS